MEYTHDFGPYGSEPFFGRRSGTPCEAWRRTQRLADRFFSDPAPTSFSIEVRAGHFAPMEGSQPSRTNNQLIANLCGGEGSFSLYLQLPFTTIDSAFVSYYDAMNDHLGLTLGASRFKTHKTKKGTFRRKDWP